MRIFKQFAGITMLALATAGAQASPQNPANGVEYQTLPVAQPAAAGKKVEVLEFFAYWCPHCNIFEPQLEAWLKKQGDNVVIRRVHVPYNDMTLPQQKLYFTMDAMGVAEQNQARVFEAIHVQREKFTKDEQVFDWVAKHGFDRNKFIETYRSMPVQIRVKQAEKAMKDYGIDSWPMIIIDGRYKTSPQLASTTLPENSPEPEFHAATLKVMDFLVTKAKAEKK